MLLVSSTHADEKLDIDDSCPHCLERIRLTIDRARLRSAEPESAYAFYGGG